MVSLRSSFDAVAHCSNGRRDFNLALNNGDFEWACYNIGTGVGSPAYACFYAFTSSTATLYRSGTVTYPDGTGGTNTDTYTNEDVVTIDNQSDITTETNGGRLLRLANDFKDDFFGGVTQTAASLFAWLQNNYGDYTHFYCQTLYNPVMTRDPWGHAGAIETEEIECGCGQASGYTFNPSSVGVTFSGGNYGTVAESYPAGSNHDDYVLAAFIFGINHDYNELQFDVYVDGTQDPNVSIKWKANQTAETFSLQLVTPIVWTLPKSSSEPSYPYVLVDGIYVPNEANSMMRKHANTWPGSYFNPYLTEFNGCTDQLDTFTKTQRFGTLGIASSMQYLLRFNKQKNENNQGVMTWGDLFIVEIPRSVSQLSDITVTRIDPSINEAEFTTKVVVHLGAPPDEIPDDDDDYPDGEDSTGDDPGVYEPDKTPHDFDPDEADGYPGHAILTKTYSMDAAKLANVGSKLWSQAYYDVTKIQSNPIENIVSMKWFPFSVTGVNGRIKVGDVDFQLDTDVVSNIYKFTVGSVTYEAHNKSSPTFLDLSPYTQLKLHLPYCGVVQLDATEMLNRKLTVKYTVDLVSGDCMAFLYLDDNVPYMNVAGHCGVDVPLTSSNRVQTELRAASTTLSAVTGAAGHVLAGDYGGAAVAAAQGMLSVAGMDYTCQRTASHSPACTSTGNRACYLEVWRPAFKISEGFKSRHGYPCHLFKALGSFTGFVKCDARTKLDFACTSEENEMLERLLTEGVYITQRDPSWSPT